MNKQTLLNASMMTPMERSAGRFMRAPDHDGAGDGTGGTGGTPSGDQNNGGGNSGNQGGSSGTQDNTGSTFDPTTFWDQPSGSGSSSGSGESAGSGSGGEGGQSSQGSGQQGQGGQRPDPGQAFAQRLENLSFGTPVTNEAIEQLANERNPEGLNAALNNIGRESVRQGFLMSAQLMQAAMGQMQERMEARMQEMLSGEFGNRDEDSFLQQQIPSYSNPAVRPVAKAIFTRAMELNGNNRDKAMAMTKEMLKFQTQQLAPDLGLNTAPGTGADNLASTTNWVEELMGRE